MLKKISNPLNKKARQSIERLIIGNLALDPLSSTFKSKEVFIEKIPLNQNTDKNNINEKHRKCIKVGQFAQICRIFTEEDVQDFARLSGDLNIIHLKPSQNVSSKNIVQGSLTTSLIPTIFSSRCPEALYVSQKYDFRRPICIGDLVVAHIIVKKIKNLRGNLVLECSTNIYLDYELENLAVEGAAKVLLSSKFWVSMC